MGLLVAGHRAKTGNHPIQESAPLTNHGSLPTRHPLVVVMAEEMVMVAVAMGMGPMGALMTVIHLVGHKGPEPPLWEISIESSAGCIIRKSIRKRRP